ncbi:MAG: hypothetical protein IJX21_01435, partial [Alistipes sp.]|nr:hypothetical protein [Alistipes sp.]
EVFFRVRVGHVAGAEEPQHRFPQRDHDGGDQDRGKAQQQKAVFSGFNTSPLDCARISSGEAKPIEMWL